MATIKTAKKKSWKPSSMEMEVYLATFLDARSNLVVPNVSWGLGLHHEADLVAVSSAGYAKEIEIKVTRQDLKADLKKRHDHPDRGVFKQLFFAVPAFLVEDAKTWAPAKAGIIGVDEGGFVWNVRMAAVTKVKPLPADTIQTLYRLAAMRIWTLKKKLLEVYRAKNKCLTPDSIPV